MNEVRTLRIGLKMGGSAPGIIRIGYRLVDTDGVLFNPLDELHQDVALEPGPDGIGFGQMIFVAPHTPGTYRVHVVQRFSREVRPIPTARGSGPFQLNVE